MGGRKRTRACATGSRGSNALSRPDERARAIFLLRFVRVTAVVKVQEDVRTRGSAASSCQVAADKIKELAARAAERQLKHGSGSNGRSRRFGLPAFGREGRGRSCFVLPRWWRQLGHEDPLPALSRLRQNRAVTERAAWIGQAEEAFGAAKQHLRFPSYKTGEGAVRVHQERRAAHRHRRHGLRRRPQVRARAPGRRPVAGRQRGAAAGGARDDGGVDLHLHVPCGQQGHDLRAPAQGLREASHGETPGEPVRG